MKFPVEIPCTVQITEKDIRIGEPNNSGKCAAAICLKRLLDGQYEVCVSHKVARIYERGNIYPKWIINFPEDLSEWIMAFDNGDRMQPTSFEITEERIEYK